MLLKLNSKLSFNSEIVFSNSPIFYIAINCSTISNKPQK